MSELVQVETPDGSFWVRVEDDEAGGPRDTAFGGISYRLTDLPDTLETVVHSVRKGLSKAAPDEVTLEFGIELSLKSGLLVSAVTSAGGKATLKVSATWKKGAATAVSAVGAKAVRAKAAEAEATEGPDRSDGTEESGAPEQSGTPD